ncbi:MAG: YraN family protein [Brevundimonas sp.]
MSRREPSPRRQTRGGRSRREGRAAEWLAAVFLMAKGYRILGFRLKGHQGEIDLLVLKGRTLAVVEVKRRATLEAALVALSPEQQARMRAAGQALARGRPSLSGFELRLDMVALAPGRFPRHVRGLTSRQ